MKSILPGLLTVSLLLSVAMAGEAGPSTGAVIKDVPLGYKEPAADIIVSTYFKEFDPFDFAGCYKRSASYFAMMGGLVPAGNKLLIQSSAFLYCIGEK